MGSKGEFTVEVLAFDIGALAEKALHILYVALGLGLVIFFHELGHFGVAKWCGVFVERFSIGFGPILWSFKRGDTEYALSLVPFGGYVKMLGQDDMDPSQLSSEEIAEDPRSYSAKNVPQRMAIISAGVIMNIITGMLFFALAFQFGVETSPSKVGSVVTGMPAWVEGAQRGDTFNDINGRSAETFADILRGTTLSNGAIVIKGHHSDGKTFEYTISPDESGLRRMIGVSEARDTKLMAFGNEVKLPYFPGTPAANAKPAFADGDELLKFNGDKIENVPHLQVLMAQHRSETIELLVKRKGGDEVTIKVAPRQFQGLGIWADIEDVTAIRKGSPAEKSGLKIGDKMESVAGKLVGKVLNPLFLAEVFEEHAGEEIDVIVKRAVEGNPERETVPLKITPDDTPAWIEHPLNQGNPLSIPSIGAAYELTSSILKVEPGSPAAKGKIPEGVAVTKMKIESANEDLKKMTGNSSIEIVFDDSGKKNMAFAMWHLHQMPDATVTLTVKEGNDEKTYTLTPEPITGHFSPRRGIVLAPLSHMMKGDGFANTLLMGAMHTRNTAIDIYLTLQNLFTGRLSPKNLHGPLGIAQVAFEVSQQGLPKLLLFLGFLSINLAVLNFLPIPVLDGGHMVFLIWEGVTRKRPSEGVLIWASYLGLAFVLGLMLFVIYLDIFVHKMGG
jgi:regulator of sigma E protease